jgi:hypothetical protein
LSFKEKHLDNQKVAYEKQGFGLIEGTFNCRVQKLDLGTMEVVDHTAAKPNPTDTWDDTRQVWVGIVEVENTLRTKRDKLLAETDWVTLKSLEQGQPVGKVWKDYRQALRDLTTQPGFPSNVVWPSKPQG